MSPGVALLVVLAFVCATLFIALAFATARIRRLSGALDAMEQKNLAQEAEISGLSEALAAAEEEDQRKLGWLEAVEKDNEWQRAELEKRPRIVQKEYRILTLGIEASGKTSLTLKWANPLANLGVYEGTHFERYARTVSHVRSGDVITEHVFVVHDWGGEQMVDAMRELLELEIGGLLIVVDLGGKDAREVEPARIQVQLEELSPKVLKYFLAPKTIASCKAVVLFINKSDLCGGPPALAEEEAKNLYAPLIAELLRYAAQVDVRVFVGSTNYGHSTQQLFAYFVERILPRSAYDAQLLQRLKAGGES